MPAYPGVDMHFKDNCIHLSFLFILRDFCLFQPPGEPQDVYLKVACGASPAVKKFFVLIYT